MTEPFHAFDAMLDADLLSVFCRVAETKNFSRAALQLGVAQPIVTRKIKRLEADLGVPLFVRSNRGCELTSEGELLAAKAGTVLRQLADLRDEVATAGDRLTGAIALGFTLSAGMLLAPRLMPQIATRWPGLRVEVHEALSRHLLDGVKRRELALALVYDPLPDPDLLARPLLMEPLHLVGPADSATRLQAMRRARTQDLAELPLVLPVRTQIIRDLLEDAFAEAGLPLAPRYEANSTLLLKSFVTQGLGYTVTSLISLASEVRDGRLAAVPLADPGMSVTLTLVTAREQANLRAVRLVSELIVAEVHRLASTRTWPGTPLIVKG